VARSTPKQRDSFARESRWGWPLKTYRKRSQRASQSSNNSPSAELLLQQGKLFVQVGDVIAAERALRQAVTADPHHMGAWLALGQLLLNNGRASEAVASLGQISTAGSRPAELLITLGAAYFASGDHENARTILLRASNLNAPIERNLSVKLQRALGTVCFVLADYERARTSLLRATALDPVREGRHSVELLLTLGAAHFMLGDLEEARTTLLHALTLDPLMESKIRLRLAWIDAREERWDLALAEAERALTAAAKPELVAGPGGQDSARYALEAYQIRRLCYLYLCRMEECVAETRRILAIAPDADLHSRLILDLNFLAGMTPEVLYQEACRWSALYAAPLQSQILPHTNSPDPERRIKLGYLSPDLYTHAIMKGIAPVLDHHDHSQFEIFVYSVGSKTDGITDQLRSKLEHFVALPAARNEIVERVRADGIDILVDLAGHSMACADAYLAFALKPAPVQVSWMGIVSTTGLSTIDYFLGCPDMPYPGTEHLFSETVYRLPHIDGCYRRLGPLVSPAPFPYFERGHITFGSFNSPRKVTRDVVKLWSAILHLAPRSRLLLKYKDLENPMFQEQFCAWFRENGIARERIDFEGESPAVEYLHSWGKVDIALDPFPYQGGTTTLDALWLGVPVVALSGRLTVQCCGTSMLKPLGLPVAETPEQYIELALCLAENIPKEPGLRSRVHEAFRCSRFMDEVGLVRSVEAAFRDMWRTWCRTRT
jgi:protein O-GlcNAc transferase